MNPFAGWEDYYVIVGSSAGALIGLQFVVMTLIASLPVRQGSEQAGRAFATPTIVHFGTVLLLAGLTTAPWESVTPGAVLWGVVGIIGTVYIVSVWRRMRGQDAYRPEMEDWLFHVVLPIAAYFALVISAILIHVHQRGALFGNAAAAMLLLFVGIHNAWDAITYHVFVHRKEQ